jgi:hypothetical protein
MKNRDRYRVMLSGALQRNAKHEARLSNISDLMPGLERQYQRSFSRVCGIRITITLFDVGA